MTDLSLRQLECFVAVAEELHVSRAARRLGLAQPPVSRLVTRLERNLGARLFERSRRGLRLTAAGEAILGPARRTLAEARCTASAARRAAAGEVGTLTIGFSSSAAFSVLPDVVRRYRARHPEVQITLRELVTARQFADVEAGLLDLAIARGPAPPTELVVRALHDEPFVAVVPKGHALARQRRVSLTALAAERFVFIPRHVAPLFHDAILRACHRAGAAFTAVEEAAEWHTIVGLVAAGLGVSIVPASLARLRWKSAVFVPLAPPRLVAELVLVHRRDPAPLVAGFVRVAEARRG
jgi:DNA-binding transcriptional LysR family regulator